MKPPRLAVVVAEFNSKIALAMLSAGLDEARVLGARVVEQVRVPGSYETPFAADLLFRSAAVDGVVVLGYIERGETEHGAVMGRVVHAELVRMSLRYEKPVGLGFVGPGATLRQAEKRKAEYARAAVRAALRMIELKRSRRAVRRSK